jgi:hypothetical protein
MDDTIGGRPKVLANDGFVSFWNISDDTPVFELLDTPPETHTETDTERMRQREWAAERENATERMGDRDLPSHKRQSAESSGEDEVATSISELEGTEDQPPAGGEESERDGHTQRHTEREHAGRG